MAQISCKLAHEQTRETGKHRKMFGGYVEFKRRAVGTGRQAYHPPTNDIEYMVASWTCTDLSEDEDQDFIRTAHGLSSGCRKYNVNGLPALLFYVVAMLHCLPCRRNFQMGRTVCGHLDGYRRSDLGPRTGESWSLTG
jgi:hypothetical protein